MVTKNKPKDQMDSKTSLNRAKDLIEEAKKLSGQETFGGKFDEAFRWLVIGAKAGDTIGEFVLVDRKDLFDREESNLIISQIIDLKKRDILMKKLKKLTEGGK